MLLKEIDDCPFEVRQKGIIEYIKENSSIHVGPNNNDKIDEMAKEIMATGVKYKDACHISSARLAECEYFISTDKRLLKYQCDDMKLVTPIEFVSIMEEEDYE